MIFASFVSNFIINTHERTRNSPIPYIKRVKLLPDEDIMTPPSRGAGGEPGQDGNVAALTHLPLCGGFLFTREFR